MLRFPQPVPQYHDVSWRSLVNLGNTCWGNAVLAVLSKVHIFRAWTQCHVDEVQDGHNRAECPLCQPNHDLRLLSERPSKQTRTFKPLTMLFRRHWCEAFNNREQQDAYQACNVLFGACDKVDRNRVRALLAANNEPPVLSPELRATTPYYHIFGGTLLQTIRCDSCNGSSTKEEPFALMTLPMLEGDEVTLDELIIAHHSEEPIPDECQFHGCRAADCRRQSYRVATWPRVLVIHLRRWNYNIAQGNADKRKEHVEFGEEFRPEETIDYALRGVVVHSGPAGRGHYTAFARGPTESTWHYYDDSCEPRATTSANVLAAQAYLLVYEQA